MLLFSRGRAPGCRRHAVACLLVALLGVHGCSPTFNWRELRPQGTPLQALMPCKPEHATRSVPLAGASVAMNLHSCDAGGLSFAVAWVELGDPRRVEAALVEWPRASMAALRQDPALAERPEARWDFRLQGASRTVGLAVQGTGPQGQAVQVRTAYFAQGSQVFQAVVYGQRLPTDVTTTFFEGVHLP